jgi:hypothetical protein
MRMIARRGMMMIVLLSFCFAACEKKNKDQDNQDCEYIEAKLIRVDCDEVIYRLMTNEAIGDANWTNVMDGQVYTNVVRFRNTCWMAEKTNGYAHQTIYVKVKKIDQPVLPTNCYEYQAISRNPPQQWVDFLAISTTPCGPEFILD